mmetsp:Transcript_43604/g.81063  ORF Transcript_43604/g.81063 Transcript_43604/m.81063 type:complete len:228 (-) Transcript_43604:102-785(-)
MADPVVVCPDDIKCRGFLWKESKLIKTWRRRWLVLTSECLCAFKTEGSSEKPTEYIRLMECYSVKSAENITERRMENSFCVVTAERTFVLIADSAAEKEAWMGAIVNCCLPQLICKESRRSLSLFPILEDANESENREVDVAAWVHASELEVYDPGFKHCSTLCSSARASAQGVHSVFVSARCLVVNVIMPLMRNVTHDLLEEQVGAQPQKEMLQSKTSGLMLLALS